MDEPIRHRQFTKWDIEDMRRMTPEQKLRLALELSGMVIKLIQAGRRSRGAQEEGESSPSDDPR